MTTQHLDLRGGGLRHELEAWWFALPEAVRSPTWPSALAALVILFLLLAFHQVVRQAVHQGEMLRMATATHSEAAWRCHSARGVRMRENCLAQLNQDNSEATALQTGNTVAQLGRR